MGIFETNKICFPLPTSLIPQMGAFGLHSFLFILSLVITENRCLDDLTAVLLTVVYSSNLSAASICKALSVILLSGYMKATLVLLRAEDVYKGELLVWW